ncbi:DNA-directed RNA polymerase subunit E'' [Candidatus Woesearchaeota archaeon]|nr:DNA-directed RNA polymerase subunit E'' [Candidatus Woesearchaeota archaeon]
MTRKVCRKCKIFVEKDACKICNQSDFTEHWKGKIYILNNEKSEIAKKIGIKVNGEYVIKT